MDKTNLFNNEYDITIKLFDNEYVRGFRDSNDLFTVVRFIPDEKMEKLLHHLKM